MRRFGSLVVGFVLPLVCAALPAVASAPVTNTTITSGPQGPIDTDSATFTFVSPEKGGFECRLDSGAWSSCASPKTYSSLTDGPHVFEVRALNLAGHPDPTPAAARFSVEIEPPDTTIVFAPSGTIGVDSVGFEFTSTEAGGFECSLDGGGWATCSSPLAYTDLADGDHVFEVRAVNDFGKADPTPASATFGVDTTPPETAIASGPSGTIDTSAATFEFSSSEPGSFECKLDASAWSTCSSPQTYEGLADGDHTFEVRAEDAVGNVDPTPASAAFHVYTGPPPPVAGETVNLEPVEGTVELQCPGEDEASRLTSFKQVPLGCLVNTRHGVVDLTASKGQSGELQGGHFWGGVFITSQEAGDNKEVELKLAGRRMCERRGVGHRLEKAHRRAQASSQQMATASRRRRHGRKLWGSGKGNFKTSGSYGSATVRGTTWLVVDRCDSSTLIKVGEGTVWVRDFVKGKSLTLTTGQQYIAKASIPRLDPDIWH